MVNHYPRHPPYHPHEAYGRSGFSPPVIVITGLGPKPEAIIHDALRGSRTVEEEVTLLIATDHSGSTDSTDPDNARNHDLLASLQWAMRNLRVSDRIILIGFTDAATATGPLSPAGAHHAALSGRPGIPGSGGTAYFPIARQALASIDQVTRAHLVVVTDGMAHDVTAFADAVGAAGLKTTLVPFGQDWPFVKTDWDHRRQIRLAAHVSNQPLAIARAITHATFELTGQTPKSRGRRTRQRRTRASGGRAPAKRAPNPSPTESHGHPITATTPKPLMDDPG